MLERAPVLLVEQGSAGPLGTVAVYMHAYSHPTFLQGGVGSKSTLTAFQRGSDKVGPECRQSARRRPKRPGAAPATRCAPPLRRHKLPVPRAAPKTGRQTAAAAAHGRPNGARAAAAARSARGAAARTGSHTAACPERVRAFIQCHGRLGVRGDPGAAGVAQCARFGRGGAEKYRRPRRAHGAAPAAPEAPAGSAWVLGRTLAPRARRMDQTLLGHTANCANSSTAPVTHTWPQQSTSYNICVEHMTNVSSTPRNRVYGTIPSGDGWTATGLPIKKLDVAAWDTFSC